MTAINPQDIVIRKTTEADYSDIIAVETEAFAKIDEARLTAKLLKDKSAEPLLSLLAFHINKAAGHILFTRAYINGNKTPLVHILAPLAVRPQYQKKGIGGMLINEGIRILKTLGSTIVFVLGHPEYYPRYGFIPDAGSLGFHAPYPIPEEHAGAWMVQPLKPGGLDEHKGNIRCAEELNRPEYWRDD